MSVKEMILDSKHECMSRDEMAALQGERLVDLVNRVYNNVPFYTKKMKPVILKELKILLNFHLPQRKI